MNWQMPFLKKKKERSERGQSLVELTIGFSILLLILSGLLDLGRLYYIFVSLEDGAGEAALYLSINPECWQPADGAECADPNNGLYRASNAGGGIVDWTSATVNITPPNAVDRDEAGDTVTVSIRYNFQLLTPIIPQIAGVNPLPITAEAAQVIVSD